MKLSEALSIRKDLQKRIAQLEQRIANNVKVQDGDEPSENPDELIKELESCLAQLEDYIWRINNTNASTVNENGVSLTRLLAERDVLALRVATLRNVFNRASETQSRYSNSEIKMVTVIDVKRLSKQVDELSAKLRTLDIEIQSLNFLTELL